MNVIKKLFSKKSKKTNILALDGGGIFGAHTAVVLDTIEKNCPGFLNKIDLVAGTSIGGIIALGIANNLTTSQIIDLFVNASNIFTRSKVRIIKSKLGLCSKYDSVGVTNVLTAILGNKTLGELSKKVLIESFRMDGIPCWTEKLFHNVAGHKGCIYPDSCTISAVEVGKATSAAPVFFPTVKSYVDGGVTQNNPALMAISLTQDKLLNWDHNINLSDINLFSIGRIYFGDILITDNIDKGFWYWVGPIIKIMLSGNATAVNYQCSQLLKDKYCRISTIMPREIEIDDYSSIPEIIKFSKDLDLTKEIKWVKNNWFE